MGVLGSATRRLFPILLLGIIIITISNFFQASQESNNVGYSQIDPIGSVESQIEGLKFDTSGQYDAVFKGAISDDALALSGQETLEVPSFGSGGSAFTPSLGGEGLPSIGLGLEETFQPIGTTQEPKADPHYRELFSISSPDKKYWPIDFKGKNGYNANIIPHPSDESSWVVVVQHEQFSEAVLVQSEQLVCSASFEDGRLQCKDPATVIIIEPAIDGQCPDDLGYANLRKGPRDARVFYGPEAPYMLYGSQSSYICLGQWIQDARLLLEPFASGRYLTGDTFSKLTEIRRDSPPQKIEKNYFLFWDGENNAYVNYDIHPKRSYAKLDSNGIGTDIEPTSSDEQCLAKVLPQITDSLHSIHQATNSLLVTMCGRNDPDCRVDDVNTFIMTIFHHKLYKDFHADYQPYIVLFKRTAPFAVHAVTRRPFWINGRRQLTQESNVVQYREHPDSIPSGQNEFMYMTSMSWKEHGKKYHGYIDDEVFLAFGIEDSRSGVIDVKANDLLEELEYCSAHI